MSQQISYDEYMSENGECFSGFKQSWNQFNFARVDIWNLAPWNINFTGIEKSFKFPLVIAIEKKKLTDEDFKWETECKFRSVIAELELKKLM